MREKPLSNQTLMDLCGGLALLLHAGVGTADGLDLLGQQQEDPALAKLLADLARRVDNGASLAQALTDSGRFPHYLCALTEVGEAAGRTEEALNALARHYESRMSLDRRLRSALLYPCILILIMLGVIVVLLTKVLPVFDQVYAGLGGQSHRCGRGNAGPGPGAGPGDACAVPAAGRRWGVFGPVLPV